MTVAELIVELRYVIRDTGADSSDYEYTDSELVSYIARSLDLLSLALVRSRWTGLKTTTTLTILSGETALPSDFIKEESVRYEDIDLQGTIDGKANDEGYYSIEGTTLIVPWIADNDTVDVTYYKHFDRVSATTDVLPVNDIMTGYLKNMAVFMALNRNEFSLSVDSKMVQQIVSEIILTYGEAGFGYPDERPLPW